MIFLYVIAGLIVLYIIRKAILIRSIKHYNPVDASDKLKRSRNILLLDVRTPSERKEKNIKGSLHIPLQEIKKRADELNKFKNKEIICYCRTGNRSLSAAAKLKKLGFQVANLKGGIIQWKAAGLR